MKLLPSIFAKFSNGYDAAVGSHDRTMLPREVKNEDGLLNNSKRAKVIAVQRDAFRNTTFSPATALQIQINTIGNEGGKLTFCTDDEAFNAKAGHAFRRWAKHCGFSDGICLNEMLQLLLIQLTHNDGDFIAVFDDGILTGGNGSGRIRIFESDEIKCVEDKEFERIYPSGGYYQSNGLVYDRLARVVGAFVSTRGRAKLTFSEGEYIHLKLATPSDFTESNWIFVANRWRNNQGRGVSTATHVCNLLRDLAETQGAEVQAAKLNAGMGIVISDPDADETAESVQANGWADTSSTDDLNLTEEQEKELEAAEASENAALKQASTNISAGKSAIIKLQGNKKLESFKTERPNLNTVQFISNQRNEAGTVFGLPSCYTTLEPAGSYTAFRGAMVMAERAFARLRKKLERDFLDWVAVRFVEWSGFSAPDGFEDELSWRWPSMPEVDEGSWQNAIEKMFANGIITAQDLNGANWRKVADQQAIEKAYYEERGLVYPASRTVSGAVVSPTVEESEGVKPDDN